MLSVLTLPFGVQGIMSRELSMRRVVVTGMGMLTPMGGDRESTWSALLAGHSGVGPITLFDARTFPTRIAAEVKDFRLSNYVKDSSRWSEYSRNTQFALAAATMAMEDARLCDPSAPSSTAGASVCISARERVSTTFRDS